MQRKQQQGQVDRCGLKEPSESLWLHSSADRIFVLRLQRMATFERCWLCLYRRGGGKISHPARLW